MQLNVFLPQLLKYTLGGCQANQCILQHPLGKILSVRNKTVLRKRKDMTPGL